jgi:hypothetical protein
MRRSRASNSATQKGTGSANADPAVFPVITTLSFSAWQVWPWWVASSAAPPPRPSRQTPVSPRRRWHSVHLVQRGRHQRELHRRAFLGTTEVGRKQLSDKAAVLGRCHADEPRRDSGECAYSAFSCRSPLTTNHCFKTEPSGRRNPRSSFALVSSGHA